MNGGEKNQSFVQDNGEVITLTPTKSSDLSSKDPDMSTSFDNSNISKEEIFHQKLSNVVKRHRKVINWFLYGILHIFAISYLSYATYFFVYSEGKDQSDEEKGRCYGKCGFQWCNGYGMLLILFIFAYLGLFYYVIFKPAYGKEAYYRILKPTQHGIQNLFKNKIAASLIVLLVLVAVGVFLYFETHKNAQKLVALLTPLVFLFTGYVFSTNRRAIKWKTVLTGICLQFLLGVICIRWEVGRNIFQCIGNKVATFLSYSEDGCRFVFGNFIVDQKIFAFAVIPVIFFFSFFISMLYYLGVMQFIISKLGWILQKILGTTVCESVNAAANIFLGMTEAPLLIRPYIKSLTGSEIHSIIVSGFATVSGTVLAAYMSYGAKPEHLITASVMAAPASLAWSKLFYPETEESETKSDNITMEKPNDSSILDAASKGATIAIDVILGIVANLVAFISFVAFLNGIVNWLGYLVGLNNLTFENIFSKIFMPLSWMMGVSWEESETVAQVIATKTVINEFVAYERLGAFMDAGLLTAKSSAIATFAICGFANPSSLGIVIGTLGAMAPERRDKITAGAFRAFIAGSIVCFVSASFAGLLMPEDALGNIRGFHNSTTNLTLS